MPKLGILRQAARACLLAGALCTGPAALAASLQISPVIINLAPGERATTIRLENTGMEPIYGQVRVFAWSQRDGQDALEPTQAIVASPPLLQIPPRSSQIVRLLQAGDLPAGEQSFRMLIDEIAPPGQAPRTGVDVRLRYSVPIFAGAQTAQPVAQALTWSLVREGDALRLQLHNAGPHRAQVSQVVLESAGRRYAYEPGLLGYALADSTRRWPLPDGFPASAAGGAVQIQAVVNTVATRAPVGAAPQR
ncbi:fimbrial biogenesis chaperone [Bordetella genomosp. 5]|uniref:fimbrial biogenesis chaperone n=1 Tax=Bordetella genomosp. 5 TaxID=1395608 RepID=UPI002015F167|nr:molecular chaperone [Bordetella genomosp. 5]